MCATFVIDVDDVIGRIEYVRRFKVDTVALLRKLIVGGAGDDLGFQAWQGFVVDDGAERVGHEYFGQGIVNLIGRDLRRGEGALGHSLAVIVDITDQQDRAGIAEAGRQVPADISNPLYRDADTLQIVLPKALPHRRQTPHAVAGEGHRPIDP
jgi:hypothetical protein